VMGGESAHSRDLKMAALLNTAFANAGKAPASPTIEVAESAPKAESSAKVESTAKADDVDDDDDQPAARSKFNRLARRFGHTLAKLSPVQVANAATAPPQAAARHEKKEPSQGWSIQIGAFAQSGAAEKVGHQTLERLSGAHGKAVFVVVPNRGDKERLYRARIIHFTEGEAEQACRVLHKKHHPCAVVAPNATQVASR